MEKIYTYMMIVIFMMIILHIFGFATTGGTVLGTMGLTEPSSLNNILESSVFNWMILFGFAALIALTVVSLLSKTVSDLPITAGLASLILVIFIKDIAGIAMVASAEWEQWLIFLLLAPLVGGYAVALWDWVRGKD